MVNLILAKQKDNDNLFKHVMNRANYGEPYLITGVRTQIINPNHKL